MNAAKVLVWIPGVKPLMIPKIIPTAIALNIDNTAKCEIINLSFVHTIQTTEIYRFEGII